MAREIQLGQFGNHAMENAERLLRAIVLEGDRMVKKASPVDTGRFRGSWAIGENSAPSPGLPAGDYRGPQPPPLAIGYTLGQERLGNVYSIHNNLPYAEPLAQGHSKQAPQGWIEAIVNDLQTRTRIAAERINRES